jgi:hypothetical protein
MKKIDSCGTKKECQKAILNFFEALNNKNVIQTNNGLNLLLKKPFNWG